MRLKLTWLLAALLTFVIGVAVNWFHLRKPYGPALQTTNTSKLPDSLRGLKRIRVCLNGFDISLGDSFQDVDRFIDLTPDPNGPNQNSDWRQGEFTDFYSVSQPSIEIDKDRRLNPAIYCTFDDQKRLKSFFVSWRFEGHQTTAVKRKILDTLIQREHTCMRDKLFPDWELIVHTDRSDFDDHSEIFAYDFRRSSSWSVGYVIETKDFMYGRRLTSRSTGRAIS